MEFEKDYKMQNEKHVLSTYLEDPAFPTITPKAICKNKSDIGSWRIADSLKDIFQMDEKTRAQVQKDIHKSQLDCIKEKDALLGEINVRPYIDDILNGDEEQMHKIECPTETSSSRYRGNPYSEVCKHNFNTQSALFTHYCTDMQNEPIDLNNLFTECEKREPSFAMKCVEIDESNHRAYRKKVQQKNAQKGLQFCYPKNNNHIVSPLESSEPCSFNRALLELELHRCFLEEACPKDDKVCRKRGIIQQDNTRYYDHRGTLHRDFWKK